LIEKRIIAIYFDMGGTLCKTIENEEQKRHGIEKIIDLLGGSQSPIQFKEILTHRATAYKIWAQQSLVELSEEALWTRWLLPDWPAKEISSNAVKLNKIWRQSDGTEKILPETKSVIHELFHRGYHLGLISNTTSRSEAPTLLKDNGIYDYFETIQLSTEFGRRKPDPSIFLAATEAMHVQPEYCAYIGDQPDRDVAGSCSAGFSKSILIRDPNELPDLHGDPALTPDHIIETLQELLSIFPNRYCSQKPKSPRKVETPKTANFNVALSSMWAIGRFECLEDFSNQAEKLGFASLELNHQLEPSMLEQMELNSSQITGIHEPCPSDVSTSTLKELDWLISTANEDCRCQGVRMVMRSINFAHDLGAKVVIIHCGSAGHDRGLEEHLRTLFEAGAAKSDQYLELKDRLIELRTKQVGPHLEAVQKSLKTLIEYTGDRGICLALENRYHYMEIPSPNELGVLLELAGADRLGFCYDIGHAYTLDRLGFYPHEQWLKSYASRIVEAHLHDVRGLKDHFPPGLGDVDYSKLMTYFPPQALLTFEVQSKYSSNLMSDGLHFLFGKKV
jgi:putative hydrolase of the HAD superfamily